MITTKSVVTRVERRRGPTIGAVEVITLDPVDFAIDGTENTMFDTVKGSVELVISLPTLFNAFKTGDYFYLTFTPTTQDATLS